MTMAKLLKLLVFVFAVIGVAVSGMAGYMQATHPETVARLMETRKEMDGVPGERRVAVMAELPGRAALEREVLEDMAELSEERRQALFEQLEQDRAKVLERFKQQVAREAETARKKRDVREAITEPVREAARTVTSNVLPALSGGDPLAGLKAAHEDMREARSEFGQVRTSGSNQDEAVRVLKALDRMGDEYQALDRANLSDSRQRQAGELMREARQTLYDMRQTPGLNNNEEAAQLLSTIGAKLGN
jgi:hypothetical protein